MPLRAWGRAIYLACVSATCVRGAELTVDLELSPGMVNGTVTRCVCLRLFDCATQPEEVCVDVAFTDGNAYAVEVPIPAGEFQCVEARDPLHTLRAVSIPDRIGRDYRAAFVGAPSEGGNWLILGNLNDDVVIDVLDVGTFKHQVEQGVTFPTGDTPCGTAAPHADVNGDGEVNGGDHFIIAVVNFISAAKLGCWETVCGCDDPDMDTDGDGVPDCIDVCPGVNDQLFAPHCADGIPAASEWGIVVFALCLLSGSKIVFRSRSVLSAAG